MSLGAKAATATRRSEPDTASPEATELATAVQGAVEQLESDLLAQLGPAGHWTGELSSSALSTATASFALLEVHRQRANGLAPHLQQLTSRGLDWLADHANSDGGWGDTVRSQSNLSTTTLCWAALVAGGEARHQFAIAGAQAWIEAKTGSLDPAVLKREIEASYGDDRTFSIPILTMCALAGCLGPREESFRGITSLPFELAAFPQSWFRFLGLPVVSYALPALIAVGQVQHRHRPTWFWPLKVLRQGLRRPTLDRLLAIQPASGGFLEAAPLTSFVTMSLAAAGEAEHPVVEGALSFLENSARDDGSWPIDENLATWVSTLAVGALSTNGEPRALPQPARERLRSWLLDQQFKERHPFTGADPGGWAWTDLSGGVPDADDTPGALLALKYLGDPDGKSAKAARAGITWLLDLQNRDGGIPTFCRGWGKLPFDRSSPDLTAHTVRAFIAWRDELPPALAARVDHAITQACDYLRQQQRTDGSWAPLWFGNEAAKGFENLVYGTSRVLRALESLRDSGDERLEQESSRGVGWLLGAQNSDGGWGGARGAPSSFEETALAIDALAGLPISPHDEPVLSVALQRGARYLVERVDSGAQRTPTPIGFYFANLWYFEQLYPLVFGLSALTRLQR